MTIDDVNNEFEKYYFNSIDGLKFKSHLQKAFLAGVGIGIRICSDSVKTNLGTSVPSDEAAVSASRDVEGSLLIPSQQPTAETLANENKQRS